MSPNSLCAELLNANKNTSRSCKPDLSLLGSGQNKNSVSVCTKFSYLGRAVYYPVIEHLCC